MIPEREREALMRLTMCAREDCVMCEYKEQCNFDFQYDLATKNMNILADALRADRKTENCSEKPNNCEDLQDWKDRMWAEAIVTEPTISKMEQVDESQTEDLFTDRFGDVWEWRGDAWYCISGDEPQTDCAWK